MLKPILIGLGILSCTTVLTSQTELVDAIVKRYEYSGDSFETLHSSAIDTVTYNSSSIFKNGKIVSTYYPNYYGLDKASPRTIEYQYNTDNRLQNAFAKTTLPNGKIQYDTASYFGYDARFSHYPSFKEIEAIVLKTYLLQIDSSFINRTNNYDPSNAKIRYMDEANAPYIETISTSSDNKHALLYYNEHMDLTKLEIANTDTTVISTCKYEYDSLGRKVSEDWYLDDFKVRWFKVFYIYEVK